MFYCIFQTSGLYAKELSKTRSADQAQLASLPGTAMSGYIQPGFDPEYALIFTWKNVTRNLQSKVKSIKIHCKMLIYKRYLQSNVNISTIEYKYLRNLPSSKVNH